MYLESTYAIPHRVSARVSTEKEGKVLEGGVVFWGMVGFEMGILRLTLPRHFEVVLWCIRVGIGVGCCAMLRE